MIKKTRGDINRKLTEWPVKTHLSRCVFLCLRGQPANLFLEHAMGFVRGGATSYNISNSNYTNGLGIVEPLRLYPIVALKRSHYGVSYFSNSPYLRLLSKGGVS